MEGTYQYETWVSEGLGVSFLKEGRKWDTEEDVVDVVGRISECPNLKFLELEGNTLGVSASKAIGKALESKRELEAALWKDLFTGRLKNEIPQSFNFLFAGVDLAGASLQRLDLSDNAIGPVGMVGLGPFFKSRSSFSLKELILNNNGFGPEGGSSLAEALLECLRLSKESGGPVFQLKVFVCGRNRLENKAAKRLAEFFKQVQTLEEVHMPQNGIYKEGIGALSEGIRCNKNMHILNLNDNTIRGEGIVKLASAIVELKDLKELSLTDCLLKGRGVMKVINALKESGSVRKVNFSGNELSKASGKQAAEALRTLPHLEEVTLSSNSLGTEGGEFITNILHQVTVIIEDDDGTEEEDEESEEEGEISNAYEEVSSADEQENTGDAKLKQSAIDTFIASPTETNFLMLDKDSPYDILKQYFSDIANQSVTFGQHCVNLALKIASTLESERKGTESLSDKLVTVCMNLLSDGLESDAWTPNEFTTYLMIKTGIFRAECDVPKSDVIKLNPVTMYCISKWLTERVVSRNVAYYLAVISRFYLRERCQEIGVDESSLKNFQKVSESAYNYSLKMGSKTTIPVVKAL